MTTPTIPDSGAPTLNRKWVYEIDTSGNDSGVWGVLESLTNSQFQPDQANMVGDTDQAGKGFQSSSKTGATWSGTATVSRKVKPGSPLQYPDVQEYVRLKAIGQFGTSNVVRIRVSEYDPNDPTGLVTPRVEAYVGHASVSWAPQGGDMLAEDEVQISFSGQGDLLIVAHPYPATASVVPVLSACNPGSAGHGTIAAAGGVMCKITGSGFSTVAGASHVTFGGTNATVYAVENDSTIWAVAPAHAAGAVNLVVTNTTGASTALSVTYA